MPRCPIPVLALFLVAAVAPAAHAQGSGFDGTWTLNLDKSTFEPLTTRPDRRIVTMQVKGNEITQTTETGKTVFLDVEPFQEVSTTKVTFTAKFDGKDYPVPNSPTSVRLKKISAKSFQRTATSGSANETSTWTLSADGKTLTVTTKGIGGTGAPYSNTQVYEPAN
jgi:hypothetical protein